MKAFLLLAFVVLVVLIVLNRERVYVRDPLATVYKTEGHSDLKPSQPTDPRNEVKQAGVEVYINYLNDVLLISQNTSGVSRTLVQNWSKMPGTPTELKC